MVKERPSRDTVAALAAVASSQPRTIPIARRRRSRADGDSTAPARSTETSSPAPASDAVRVANAAESAAASAFGGRFVGDYDFPCHRAPACQAR